HSTHTTPYSNIFLTYATVYALFLLVCFICSPSYIFSPFFFNDTATTEIYTLSLHDALPIWISFARWSSSSSGTFCKKGWCDFSRSEEHTSELQSRENLVCRLLLEKKKKKKNKHN